MLNVQRVEPDQDSQERHPSWNLPGGPVVKNPLSNAGDVGLIPGRGT